MRLFGVRLVSDLYERACELGVRPPLDAKRKRWLAAIRARDLLFIHIPKTAGMSISRALYGQHVTHCTIRYYAKVAPELVVSAPSFAVVRDPVRRFLSAYGYARSGGSRDNVISPAFRDLYAGFRSIDEALDHVESARNVYRIDQVFRPQGWFVRNAAGEVAVDRLVPFDDLDSIAELVPRCSRTVLPRLNQGGTGSSQPSPEQRARIRMLYAEDFALLELAQRAAQR
jgi:hypothetical protein